MKEEMDKLAEEQNKFFKQHLRHVASADRSILLLTKTLMSYEQELKKITRINETIEQTLQNVLVAIRQNEYLQAYYPAQCGLPAMNVIGTHPYQSKREELQ